MLLLDIVCCGNCMHVKVSCSMGEIEIVTGNSAGNLGGLIQRSGVGQKKKNWKSSKV